MTPILNDMTGLNLSLKELGIVVPDDSLQQYVINVTVNQPIPVFTFVFSFIAFYFLMLIFHELGHWFVLRKYHPLTQIKFGVWPLEKKPRLWTGNEAQYDSITPRERINVYIAGIVIGAIPVILAGIIDIVYLGLIVPYVLGVIGDYKQIGALNKQIKQEKVSAGVKNEK
jgi:hypothetical protein